MNTANPDDFLFLGLKGKVSAIRKSDGHIAWSTQLSDGLLGDGFVTLTCDHEKLYCYTKGQLHCLDIKTGHKLWSNDLPGYGYGIATLCLHGQPQSPDPIAHHQMMLDQQSNSTGA
jgi:hypothetical protein